MVLNISRFIASRQIPNAIVDVPILTSIPTYFGGNTLSSRFGFDDNIQRFWRRFEENSELVSTLQIPITDILGDRVEFTGVYGEKLSKEERLKASRFWRDNRGKETIKAWLFDAFLTGSGYIWMGKPSEEDIMKGVKEALRKKGISLQTKEMDYLMKSISQDEDLKKPKAFDYVASSTMRIISSELEILGYEQMANGMTAHFEPDKIIHFRYLTLNGKTQGFTPIKPLMAEIMLLTLVKQNMLSWLENGGTPDKVFVLPKEIAKSKNHQFLIETLQKYKKIQNRHGNLVFTGEIDIKDLQGNPKDMEYKDLALYITSNIAFAYGIPISRIPYLIGSSATGGDSGGLANQGYWSKISDMQNSVEDLLNSQLFEKYGWNIRFSRNYKIDEVRDSQVMSMIADSVTKYQSIFSQQGKKVTTEKILDILKWNDEDIEDAEEELVSENHLVNQNMLPNIEIERESDNRKKAQTKRESSTNTANQKGVVASSNT